MTEIKEVRCPGCGKEMRRHRYDCGWGARIAWYECEICGWRAPMCADDNRAYEMAMRRCGDNDTTAVDAEPVRRGHWIKCNGKSHIWYCLECGDRINYNQARRTYKADARPVSAVNKYCRCCGAKMDGVEK